MKVHEAAFDRSFPGTKPLCFYMDYYPEKSLFTAFRSGYTFAMLDGVRIVRHILNALPCVHEIRRAALRLRVRLAEASRHDA